MKLIMELKISTHQCQYRLPRKEDGLAVWTLSQKVKGLDVNTLYCYFILCEHFAETSVVCERNGELLGFLFGYNPPKSPGSLFVWQVGVDPEFRGCGLAGKMLSEVWNRESQLLTSQVQATVSPNNKASLALFCSFAKREHAEMKTKPFLSSRDFGPTDHEPEELIEIRSYRKLKMRS